MTRALEYRYGIAANRDQFIHRLVQVLLVGLAIGMTRTVVPALAKSGFGVARGSFLPLASVALPMFASGLLLLIFGTETRPVLSKLRTAVRN